MSDLDDTYDDGTDENEQSADTSQQNRGEEPGWRKRLTSDRDKAKAERDALKRENAFLKAGVNPEDSKAKWLVKGYDGELTPEAIKQAAVEAGLLEVDDEADDIPDAERQAHERIAGNATGGRSTGAYDFDAAIAEAKAAGQTQRVIELRQAQAAAQRAAAR